METGLILANGAPVWPVLHPAERPQVKGNHRESTHDVQPE